MLESQANISILLSGVDEARERTSAASRMRTKQTGAEWDNSARMMNKIYVLLKYLLLDIKCDTLNVILHTGMCIFKIAVTVNQM